MILCLEKVTSVDFEVKTSKTSKKEGHLLRVVINSMTEGEIVILLSAPEGKPASCIIPREVAR